MRQLNMSKALYLILSIIAFLVVLAAGAVLGMFIQVQKDAPQIEKAAKIYNTLISDAIPSIVVFGKVSKIEGRTVTVSFNGDTAVVKLRDNAAVTSFPGYGQGDNTPKTIDLSQVKEGQTVSINSKISAEGVLEAESLIVLSGE